MFYPLMVWSLTAALAHPAPSNRVVLWESPRPLTVSDWIWGPGGKALAPRPPFRFVRENLGGTNPKIDVRDARGALWIVKFGGEVHTDTFASRLLTAAGYEAEPTYFIAGGVVEGVHGLKRARRFLSKDGHFHNARFKLRDEHTMAYADEFQWTWTANPFLDLHELNGLKILILLASNWDTKDARDGKGSNTAVFLRAAEGPKTYVYSFTDWGASLGYCGGFFKRSKWDPSAYEHQTRTFVRAANDGRLVWGFRGKHGRDITDGITVEDIRWLLPYLSRITDEELRAGLIASGATPPGAQRFTRSIRNRIERLRAIALTGVETEVQAQ